MANSSISTLMGPTGPKGPTAPDGSVGASGNTGPSGSSGPSGLTGAGISADAGLTNCNQRLLQNIDGDYFVIGPIDGATGSPNGGVGGVICDSCSAGLECPSGGLGGQDRYCCCGTCIPIGDPCLPDLGSPCNPRLDIEVLGTGASILRGISGPTAYFKSLVTDDPDITIQELTTPAGLKISAPEGSGQQSQIVGSTGELLYYTSEDYLVGASETFFKESNGVSAEADSLHAILGDFKELVKRHDPVAGESVTLDTNEANTHYIVGKDNFKIINAVANTNAGFTALDSSDGVTYGESVNLTMIIKNGGLADNGNPFSTTNNPFKFYNNPSLTESGTDIVNCISFNKGSEWQCFVAGLDYGVTFSNSLSIGACCTNGECRDYVFDSDCEGRLFDRTTCFSRPCESEFGACCVNNSCFNFSRGKCQEVGGNFFLNRECGTFECPDPCGGLGCCCLGLDSVDATEDICTQLGGNFVSNTPCVTEGPDGPVNPCVEFTRGACCKPNDCQEDLLPSECNNGGVYMGPQTNCDTVDCCAGQTIPLGICCTLDGCSPNFPVVQSECIDGNWNQGSSDCSICGSGIACDCNPNTPTFRKWRLWIADTLEGNIKLLPLIDTDFVSGPTGCDRMSDGYHNTYFERYDDVGLIYDPDTEAMPWAKSLNTDGQTVELNKYIPSISEMAYIISTNAQFNGALIGDTQENLQYWTSTRKDGNRFLTINEDGWTLQPTMDDNTQTRKALAVYRELLSDDQPSDGYVIGQESTETGAIYAGVFATNCSNNLSNHNVNDGFNTPTYSCANPLDIGFCCVDTTCSVQNEYDCIDMGGIYFNDNPSADCTTNSPCGGDDPEPPIQIEKNNCARAGVLSYKANEDLCAGGLAEQMYYYAGDIDTTTGEPVDRESYNPLVVDLDDFNIDPETVATNGILTQGYCVGHNRVTECPNDINVLSPNVIAAGTLKLYCSENKIYGDEYSCDFDTGNCSGVEQYDRTIDDCFSSSRDGGLCGKGLSEDFITLLNENDSATCELTRWPEDEYFPCGGSPNCTENIKVWPGTNNTWPSQESESSRKPVFSCEPCLNSFCAYVMKNDVDGRGREWCHRAGEWDQDAADLYQSYFYSVFEGDCTNDNPFCGDEVDWSSLEGLITNFGNFSSLDTNAFSLSSEECKTRILSTRNQQSEDCQNEVDGPYKELLYVNFREKTNHENLLNSGKTREVPAGLKFEFIPVICPDEGALCVAGDVDLSSTIGGSNDDARYTSLIYGIDNPSNPNESLVGTTNNNLGLCYDNTCDDNLDIITGSKKDRVESIIRQNLNSKSKKQFYGLIVTNCQNRILCDDVSDTSPPSPPCLACGNLDDLIEPFDPPTVGCYNCISGTCTEKLNCDPNEFLAADCNGSNPCPTGQCCSEVGCEELTFAECSTRPNGNWNSDVDEICIPDACICGDDVPFGNCCTSDGSVTNHTYTCKNQCAGLWEESRINTGECDTVGCCYQIVRNGNVASVVSGQEFSALCSPANGDILYSKWTANDVNCIPPTGRICDTDVENNCRIQEANEVIVDFGSGGTPTGIIPEWEEGINCSTLPLCTALAEFSCCTGNVTESSVEPTWDCVTLPESQKNLCIPEFFTNTSARTFDQNTSVEGNCESTDCSNQEWGFCCYRPSSTDLPQCAFPTGEYHCLNELHGDPRSLPTWSTDNVICETCSDPKDLTLVNCCYNVDQFGTKRCRVVEKNQCSTSTLNTCEGVDILPGGDPPSENGNAAENAEVCDVCSGCASPRLVNCCFNNGSECVMVPEGQCNSTVLSSICGQGVLPGPVVVSGDVTDPDAIGCQECEEGSCETNLYTEGTQILECSGSGICPFGDNDYSTLDGGGNPIFNQLKVRRIRFEERKQLGLVFYVIELEFDDESNASEFIANYNEETVNNVNNDPLGDQYIRFTKSATDTIEYIPNVIPTREDNLVIFSSSRPTFNPPTPSKPVRDFVEDPDGGNINHTAKYRIRFP